MQILKGFVEIKALYSNVPGVVSPIGELSQMSSTYMYEKGVYEDINYPGYRLLSAKSFDTVQGEIQVQDSLVAEVLSVARAIYVYTTTHDRPYDPIILRNTLMADYATDVGGLNIGPTVDTATLSLPEWASWTSLTHDNAQIKVWLADAAFADQYDEYEIIVIPPLTPVDQFFLPADQVVNLLAAATPDRLFDQTQDAKNGKPETYIRNLKFNYVAPMSTLTVPSYWSVLIYGGQGDNLDAIKDAIINYILAHSTHTQTQWEVILPELFKRTEFVILPRWDLYAIPDLAIQTGIHSSLMNPAESMQYVQNQIDFYSSLHIQQHTTIVPYPYKSLQLAIVAGDKNMDGKQSFPALYSDYIPVPTTSLDFNRMSLTTREWSLLMASMLLYAEKIDEFSAVPKQFRKIVRSNKLYLSGVLNNVNYLVSAKRNQGV